MLGLCEVLYRLCSFLCCADEEGRYTYKKQPEMCRWNVEKFSEALAPVLDQEKSLPLLRRYCGMWYSSLLVLLTFPGIAMGLLK